MRMPARVLAALALALAMGGCSVSSLLGGGGKAPPTLLTLSPEAAAPGEFTRAANAGQAVTINTPTIAKELRIWPASNVDALLRTADKLGAKGLADALDLLADLDYRSKTGLGDASDNVERFMLSLA